MELSPAFHSVVQQWFTRRFPGGPTPAQVEGWPRIGAGRDVLIAAPTGSGKTLAAFLVCIDRLLQASVSEDVPEAIDVVYVSPLKALARDIHQNLEIPLAEIRSLASEQGIVLPDVRAQVRTGDTSAGARAAMTRRPPHILVTTPESLYLLVTAQRSREQLRRVRTVIVDEIHAVARDKRGSHLSLTLERLDALGEHRPQRIGLSATQRPIETHRAAAGRDRAGAQHARTGPRPATSSTSGIVAPSTWPSSCPTASSQAVMSHEQWGDVLDRIAREVKAHRTTLDLREHAPLGRAHRPSPRRAPWPRPGRRASRQPVARPAPTSGGTPPRRRSQGAGGHRLARAGHRHRARRAGLSDRLATQPRHVPPARGTFGTRAGSHAEGPPLSDHAATSWWRAPRSCAACAPGSSTRSSRPVAPLDILAQQIVAACARRALARGRPLRAGKARRALRRAHARGFRRGGGDARGGNPDGTRTAGRLSASRPGQRRAAGPARRPASRP